MNNEHQWSRRLFAAAIAGSAATLAQQPAGSPAAPAAGAAQVPPPPGRRPQPVEPLPFAETLVFTRKDAELRTTPYPMSQVRLLDGPCKQAADYNRAYVMRIAPLSRSADGKSPAASFAATPRDTIYPGALCTPPRPEMRRSRRAAMRWSPSSRAVRTSWQAGAT
jgi:hypothetical protein